MLEFAFRLTLASKEGVVLSSSSCECLLESYWRLLEAEEKSSLTSMLALVPIVSRVFSLLRSPMLPSVVEYEGSHFTITAEAEPLIYSKLRLFKSVGALRATPEKQG